MILSAVHIPSALVARPKLRLFIEVQCKETLASMQKTGISSKGVVVYLTLVYLFFEHASMVVVLETLLDCHISPKAFSQSMPNLCNDFQTST